MDFKLTFNMDNAAFEENKDTETVRILRELADKIENEGISSMTHTDLLFSSTIRDLNGNKIGFATITI